MLKKLLSLFGKKETPPVKITIPAPRKTFIRGNGNIERRLIAKPDAAPEAWHFLMLGGQIDAVITVDPEAPLSIYCRTDTNLFEKIKLGTLDTKKDKLLFEVGDNIKPSSPVQLEISLPFLGNLRLFGGAAASVEGLDQELFTLEQKGDGLATLKGKCTMLNIDWRGKGELQARYLKSESVHIQAKNGKITVNAKQLASITAEGGTVKVHGKPEIQNGKVSGDGKIEFPV